MMKFIVVFLTVTVLGLTSNAKHIVPGQCNATAKPDFEIQKYMGVWYVVSEIPDPFEPGDTCQKTENILLNATSMRINETATHLSNIYMENVGTAVTRNQSEPAQFQLTYDRGHGLKTTIPYWVLDTDYVNYVVVYSCWQITQGHHFDLAWVMSRKPVLDNSLEQHIEEIVRKNNIDIKAFRPVPQTHCINY